MFERIVAAIDSDPERGAKVAAAAQELAQQSGSRALVVHVREVERPAAMVGMARPRALPPVLHVESEEEARALVDAGDCAAGPPIAQQNAPYGHSLDRI
jgi:nucleotide-binding universal stress UspA family protein